WSAAPSPSAASSPRERVPAKRRSPRSQALYLSIRDGSNASNYSSLPPLLSIKSSLDHWITSAPELARGDTRAFGHRRHLRPHDVGIDGRLPDPGAEAAIASGHDVLATDELRVTSDPLRDELGVLDEVGFRLDHAGDEHLSIRQLD